MLSVLVHLSMFSFPMSSLSFPLPAVNTVLKFYHFLAFKIFIHTSMPHDILLLCFFLNLYKTVLFSLLRRTFFHSVSCINRRISRDEIAGSQAMWYSILQYIAGLISKVATPVFISDIYEFLLIRIFYQHLPLPGFLIFIILSPKQYFIVFLICIF